MTRTSTLRPTVRRRTAAAAACGAALAAPLLVAAPAQASVLVKEHYDEQGSDLFTDCGGAYEHTYDAQGTFSFVLRGSSPTPYGADRGRATDTFTNPDTGLTFTTVNVYNDRDFRIAIDEAAGTLTITGARSGTSKAFDDSGKLLFHDAGHVRYEVVIDYGGTLADPDDDTFVSFNGFTFGPTGRAETYDRDFCADLATYTS